MDYLLVYLYDIIDPDKVDVVTVRRSDYND